MGALLGYLTGPLVVATASLSFPLLASFVGALTATVCAVAVFK